MWFPILQKYSRKISYVKWLGKYFKGLAKKYALIGDTYNYFLEFLILPNIHMYMYAEFYLIRLFSYAHIHTYI